MSIFDSKPIDKKSTIDDLISEPSKVHTKIFSYIFGRDEKVDLGEGAARRGVFHVRVERRVIHCDKLDRHLENNKYLAY